MARVSVPKIKGSPKADDINGGSSGEKIGGEGGDDIIRGNGGDDDIDGGTGNDVLYGGTGNDVLRGGAGKDTFKFAPGDGRDLIHDFNPNQDTIDLTAFGGITLVTAFDSGIPGYQATKTYDAASRCTILAIYDDGGELVQTLQIKGRLPDLKGFTGISLEQPYVAPSFSIADATVNEGAGTITFTVTRTGNLTRASSVDFASQDDSAVAGLDYAGASGTLTFGIGESSKTITISVTSDSLAEALEAFRVHLSNAVSGSIADADATGVITDDDPLPVVSIGDSSVVEGESDALIFTVTRTGDSSTPSSVGYTLSDGTTGTLTFQPGESVKTISVAVPDDGNVEPTETVTVTLSGASNATIGDGAATGTITDDEIVPELSIGDATVDEDAGTITFTVTRSGNLTAGTSVDYATSDDSATDGADYAGASGTLTFAAGEASKTITVNITDDAIEEGAETFKVVLSNVSGATVSDGEATGTINPNDVPPPVLSIDDPTVNEGAGTIVFTITRTGDLSATSTVTAAIGGGTATSADYSLGTNTVLQSITFAAGETSKTITLNVTNDTLAELSETIKVTLSAPLNATIAEAEGVGTILDDEAATLRISDATLSEDGGSMVFTITRTGNLQQTGTVNVSTGGGSAAGGVDYATTLYGYSGIPPLTFAAGEVTKTVSVPILDDSDIEASETFLMFIQSSTFVVADNSGLGTIVDNDPVPAGAILGTTGNDSLFGSNGDDVIYGFQGNDLLRGGFGNDAIYGGEGNDQIYTDGGADIVRAGSGFDFVWLAAGLPGEISDLDGGADSDTLNLSGISAGVLVSDSSGAGSDIIITSAVTGLQIGVARGFEEIDGTSSADTIDLSHQIINFRVVGDGGGDTITGGSGDDDLSGGAGNDSITGGGGNDQMSGGDGDDILVAGPDNGKTTEFNQYQDRLDGGAGNDRLVAGYNSILTGGTGADTFVFLTDPGDFTFVAQFDKGSDKIDLTGFDANANVAGQQHFVWANGSNNGQIGVLNYAQVGFGSIGGQTLADYQVTADTDGDGVVDFSFYVRYVGATMSQSDFFI